MKVSVAILTYNRAPILRRLLFSLQEIKHNDLLEVIVIDNNSKDSTKKIVTHEFPWVKYEKMEDNFGVVSRNAGIRRSKGDIVVTLDDDIIGINDEAIEQLVRIFTRYPRVGSVCFKVTAPESDEIINWCHHYDVDKFSEKEFVTNEITEGAVAFRLSTLKNSGLYAESFFISHEGPDLACRILDRGYDVIYSPRIKVQHYHDMAGRKNWRRYYYDTRNQFWFVARNYPLCWALKYLFVGLGAMFIYSVRDGFLGFWFKGVIDGIQGLPSSISERHVIGYRARKVIKEINKNRPGFLKIAKKRLFARGVRI